MEQNTLSTEDRQILIKIARDAVEAAATGRRMPILEIRKYSNDLQTTGASFVTLTMGGRLRGCIGALEARQPLVLDVQEHAAAAAVEDYRFQSVRPEEVSRLHIEISRLTPPVKLDYLDPSELPGILKPGVDGVIISDGRRRATFLPQVWEQLSQVDVFMAHLCQKMGAPDDLWKVKNLDIWTYQVEAFEEE